jgi:uncharacterized protein YndB with AHSA1/START domain
MPFLSRSSSQTLTQEPDWSAECTSIRYMTSPNLISEDTDRKPVEMAKSLAVWGAGAPAWTVRLECKVAADTRRIFDALTVPEYMEAWISVPGDHPECSNLTSRLDDGFQIEHRCSSGASTTITGTYCSFMKRKLSFQWRPADSPVNTNSLVEIRLYGDFERSILRLRHSGLESEDEFNWHSALWSASIAKLCRLFDRPSLSDAPRRQRTNRRREEAYSEL